MTLEDLKLLDLNPGFLLIAIPQTLIMGTSGLALVAGLPV